MLELMNCEILYDRCSFYGYGINEANTTKYFRSRPHRGSSNDIITFKPKWVKFSGKCHYFVVSGFVVKWL